MSTEMMNDERTTRQPNVDSCAFNKSFFIHHEKKIKAAKKIRTNRNTSAVRDDFNILGQ